MTRNIRSNCAVCPREKKTAAIWQPLSINTVMLRAVILLAGLVIDKHAFTNRRWPSIRAGIVHAHDTIAPIGHLIYDAVEVFRAESAEVIALVPCVSAVMTRAEC